ncbi:putative zinc-containing alcohol dehydrogenase [Frondihabitans sucicola]|uniref:Zinc-containing alcohol dehydrogenase n=1 Tax=Frondihabitans sucicola TaxID=1268041 RepID=A0ABM8GKE6_9MICO|nr:NAD(P)-dependent alcohol dehydrogenase [Frondihabitans sucicola]BDZ48851.1 putative zinc-containing alcohol dehydrogenase [Frondihabitans sucicola]
MEITAAISRGPASGFRLERVHLDDPAPREVVVRMVAVGVCHTDLAAKALLYGDLPVVLGHEGAGVVESVGRDVTNVAPGDHVIVSFHSCGRCPECRSGHRAYCRDFVALNTSGHRDDGRLSMSTAEGPILGSFFGQSSFATHVLASEDNVVAVDSDVDLTVAAPFGCGFQTGAGVVANVLRPQHDSKLVVYGAGGVGMAAIMAARALGVTVIVAVDLSENRRSVARDIGATHTVDGGGETAVDEIREATGGGATHALDTTSVPAVVSGAVAGLAPRGTLVIVGSGAAAFSLVGNDLIAEGKTIRGSIEGDSEPQEFIPRLVEWHRAGEFPVERLIKKYPFAEINAAAEDARSGAVIKPVLVF